MAPRTTKTASKSKAAAKNKAKSPSKSAPVKVSTATKAAVVKAAPRAAKPAVTAPKPVVVAGMQPVVAGVAVKKPELIDRVVTATGLKKKDVKPVVEATLAVLGRALSEGEELIAPPLGKVMVKRSKDLPNAKVLNVKIRVPTVTPDDDPMSDSDD